MFNCLMFNRLRRINRFFILWFIADFFGMVGNICGKCIIFAAEIDNTDFYEDKRKPKTD